MALLESCCCWRSVRRGSYASAIYTMVYFSLATLVLGYFVYEEQVTMTTNNSTRSGGITASLMQPETTSEAAMVFRVFSVVVLVCSGCGLLSTLLLLVGLHLDNKLLLIPWMFIVSLTAVIDISHILHHLVMSEEKVKPDIAMIFTLDFFLLCLNLYSLLCVVSQYQEYKAGRGRAVDEDNFLRFAPVRYLAQPTATSVLSTRRGTHTTVHEAHSPQTDLLPLPLAAVVSPPSAGPLNGSLTAACQRLAVPSPLYSRRQSAGSARKHVKFPDMSNDVRVVPDEDSSQGDSHGGGPCEFLEDVSTGLNSGPMDEKALLSTS